MVNAGSRFVVASSGVKHLSCNIYIYIYIEDLIICLVV